MDNSNSGPTHAQMAKDAGLLVKFRGYCRKAGLTLIDLPNQNAYQTLSLIMYPSGQSPERSKQAINYLWGIARNIEAFISQNGGPRLVPYPKMKTWPEDKRPAWVRFKFSTEQIAFLRWFQGKHGFVDYRFPDDVADYINDYLHSCYEHYADNANRDRAREDDLDKLETLEKQLERVIDNYGPIVEMMLGRYRYADWGCEKSAKEEIGRVYDLFFATRDAIVAIGESQRRHKPLEFELACDLVYMFWKRTGIKPSIKDTSPFPDFMDNAIEPALGWLPGENRRLGHDLLKKAIAEICPVLR